MCNSEQRVSYLTFLGSFPKTFPTDPGVGLPVWSRLSQNHAQEIAWTQFFTIFRSIGNFNFGSLLQTMIACWQHTATRVMTPYILLLGSFILVPHVLAQNNISSSSTVAETYAKMLLLPAVPEIAVASPASPSTSLSTSPSTSASDAADAAESKVLETARLFKAKGATAESLEHVGFSKDELAQAGFGQDEVDAATRKGIDERAEGAGPPSEAAAGHPGPPKNIRQDRNCSEGHHVWVPHLQKMACRVTSPKRGVDAQSFPPEIPPPTAEQRSFLLLIGPINVHGNVVARFEGTWPGGTRIDTVPVVDENSVFGKDNGCCDACRKRKECVFWSRTVRCGG